MQDDGTKKRKMVAKEEKHLKEYIHHKEDNTSPQIKTDCGELELQKFFNYINYNQILPSLFTATTSTNQSVSDDPKLALREVIHFVEKELERINQAEASDEDNFLGFDSQHDTTESTDNVLSKDLVVIEDNKNKRKTKTHTEPLRKSPRKVRNELDYVCVTPKENLKKKPPKDPTTVKACFKYTKRSTFKKGMPDVSREVSIDYSGSEISTEIISLPVSPTPMRKNPRDSIPGNSTTEHHEPSVIRFDATDDRQYDNTEFDSS